jgi:pyroglutamyl-peptidase
MDIKPDSRPTVLLTGFGPFPGIAVNASGLMIKKLARKARQAFPNHRFVTSVLPTEWRRAPQRIADLHMRSRPVLALHFGVAGSTQTIRLEECAENICRPMPDAAAMPPLAAKLFPDGPPTRRATIDLRKVAEALNAENIPCALSHDAGGYLCNAVLYHSLALCGADCKVGFVHIPADLLRPPLDLDTTVKAALVIIETALITAR